MAAFCLSSSGADQRDPSRAFNHKSDRSVSPWEQASHNGELSHAVEAGALGREDVTDLGAVLAGTAAGRRSDDEITAFDSTGLAIQDLAIALAAMERVDELDLLRIDL
jgi:ornithine cyclodeaminase/alanine dehydrogenase-like protein (mu-crystallin family)